jgi:hypothetical protein
MKIESIVAVVLLTASLAGYASGAPDCDPAGGLAVDPNCADPETDGGYAVLFREVASALSERDQKAIYAALGAGLAADGRSFVDTECVDARTRYAKATGEASPPTLSSCNAAYSVKLVDLNGDGVAEVFVTGGSSYRSGITGSSIWLFLKDAHGAYQPQFGFPAAAHKVLKSRSKGLPDIQLGGRGFCEAVWRWDGKGYAHHKNVPTQPGGCGGR